METGDLGRRRDRLLLVAAEAVRAARRGGVDPGQMTLALHAAWRAEGGPGLAFDEDFRADPATGVEALAFAVGLDHCPVRGGLVLRLRGEWPDSFEAVDLPLAAAPSLDGLRQAYFSPLI